MLYRTTEAPVRTSLDVASTDTPNAGTYDDSNARLRLNSKGQPVAIRRVVALQQPGSPAVSRYQAVTPRGIVSLSHSSLKAWDEKRAHPVN
jgi:hypothetical protein